MTKILLKITKIGDIFEFPETNTKITKDFCNRNKGDIPVYASSKHENSVLGYIKDNLKGIKYYNGCLSWNRNGSVGYVFVRKHKFATNEDHRAMIIKSEYQSDLDKEYLKYEIESKLLVNGFSFLNKCGLAKIKEIEIEIPVNQNDKFDLKKQKELSQKYKNLDELQNNLRMIYNEISNIKIDIGAKYNTQEIIISDLFDFEKGDAKYTKNYIRNNEGKYPVYSSQTINEGIIGYINSYDYNKECLTWTTDGIHAGTVFYRKGKFSMTTHCGGLFLKPKYKKDVDLHYILYQLSLYLKDYAVGEGNKRITIKIIQNIPIKIITKTNGDFDLTKQKMVSEKFMKVMEIKNNIENLFSELTSSHIDLT